MRRMNGQFLLLALLLCLLIGCEENPELRTNTLVSTATPTLRPTVPPTAPPPTVTPDLAREVEAVYLTLLRDIHGPQNIYLVEDRIDSHSYASVDNYIEGLQEELPSMELETYLNYSETASQAKDWAGVFNSLDNVVVIDSEDYREWGYCAEMAAIDMDRLQRDYPGASVVTTLSWIGFNEEVDQALVYAETDGGGCGGSTYLVLLKRESNGWDVEDMIHGEWIS